jgi:hypothetical protein
MKMKRLLLLILAVVICVPTLSRAEEETPGWALGWTGGPTLRHRILGNWELELSGGPNDYLVNQSKWEWDDNDPPNEQGIEQTPQDDKREQGWVRFGIGRTVVQDGQISLTATASLGYTWSHEQDRSHLIHVVDEEEQWRDQKTDWNRWDSALGLRISVAVLDQLWLEVDFGVVYRDSHYDTTTTSRRVHNGELNEEITRSVTDDSDFRTYGWYGTSSLGVMIWF